MIERTEKSNKDYSKLKSLIMKIPNSNTNLVNPRMLQPPVIKQIEESKSTQSNNTCFVPTEFGSRALNKKKHIESPYNNYSSNKEYYDTKLLRDYSKKGLNDYKPSNSIKSYIRNNSSQISISGSKNNQRGSNASQKKATSGKLSDIEFQLSREVSRDKMRNSNFNNLLMSQTSTQLLNAIRKGTNPNSRKGSCYEKTPAVSKVSIKIAGITKK